MNATLSGGRLRYVVLTAITVTLGLAVHFTAAGLAAALRDVMGDALWAMMIFWISGIIAPGAHIVGRAASALAVCLSVEVSQLLDTEWLVTLRNTTPGHLVLGSGFDPRDILAYSIGVSVAAIADFAGRHHRRE